MGYCKKIYTLDIQFRIMYRTLYLCSLMSTLLLAQCGTYRVENGPRVAKLNKLTEWMSGEFSSQAQAAEDSSYYDIHLVMFPIWEEVQDDARWLYVEQAVSANLEKPYRQRVYKLTAVEDDLFESAVYELVEPEKYINAWNRPEIFEAIDQKSLILRRGCSVYLRTSDNCFSGMTTATDCKSSMQGASYASSRVTVCADHIVSWDQGWDEGGKQVWGAEKGGYVFDRIR